MKAILLFLALLFTGCTVKSPTVIEYRISPTHTKKTENISSCSEKSLKIGHAFSSTSLMSQKMRYTLDDHTEFTYTESKWSRSPARAISAMLLSSIRETQIFKNVNSYKSRSITEYVLETNIEEFMQYFSDENRESYVKITLTLTLIDTRSSKIVDATTITKELAAESLNAEGGVVALNKALSLVLIQSNIWLSSVCNDI